MCWRSVVRKRKSSRKRMFRHPVAQKNRRRATRRNRMKMRRSLPSLFTHRQCLWRSVRNRKNRRQGMIRHPVAQNRLRATRRNRMKMRKTRLPSLITHRQCHSLGRRRLIFVSNTPAAGRSGSRNGMRGGKGKQKQLQQEEKGRERGQGGCARLFLRAPLLEPTRGAAMWAPHKR